MIKNRRKFLALFLVMTLLVSILGSVPKPAQAAALISHWNFDGTVNDIIGTNEGTLHGSANLTGNVLNLANATSDYVSIADADNLSFGTAGTDSPFTISAWIKPTSGYQMVILSKTGSVPYEYVFTYNGSGNLEMTLFDPDWGVMYDEKIGKEYNYLADYGEADSVFGNWIHVAATYDGSETKAGLTLYINGAAVNGTGVGNEANYDGMGNSTAPAEIGKFFTNYSEGQIDDVKIFDDALTANEMSVLFASQASSYRTQRAGVLFLDADDNNIGANETQASSASISFMPKNQVNTGDGVEITFDEPLTFTGIENVTDLNSALSQPFLSSPPVLGAVSYSGQSARYIITTQGDRPAEQITVNYNSVITSPTNPGTYIITAKVYDLGTSALWGGAGAEADVLEGSISAALVFGDFDVDISASVDPTLTLTLDTFYDASGTPAAANTCNLSTDSRILIGTEINMCLYLVHVSTNGTGGYTAYVRDTGNFSTGVDEMVDPVGATMSPGPTAAEYGIATTAGGRTISQINNFTGGDIDPFDCAYLWTNGTQTGVNASGVLESDQDFAGASGPVEDSQTALCHMAAIAGDTPNGTYTTTTIITAVGNF